MQQAMSYFKTLAVLQEGQEGIIHEFTDDLMASKLISMGVLPGKMLHLVRRVPFGGGLYVKIEGQNIALRLEEARNIVLDMKRL
jgi:ferrous iron transport protein A